MSLLNELGENTSDVHEWHVLNLSVNISSMEDAQLNNRSVLSVIIYGCIFVLSVFTNFRVIWNFTFNKRTLASVALLITHLCIADIMVTFVIIPFEIASRVATDWEFESIICTLFFFSRTYTLHLTANILMAIAIDRYLAIVHPFGKLNACNRAKTMLLFAWFTPLIFAILQSIFVHTRFFPSYSNFIQCIHFDDNETNTVKTFFTAFGLGYACFGPLIAMAILYAAIYYELSKNVADNKASRLDAVQMFRSSDTVIKRAQKKSFLMAFTIIASFVVCWTPSVTLQLWYLIDGQNARLVHPQVQELMAAMVTVNCIMNAIIYGPYAIDE